VCDEPIFRAAAALGCSSAIQKLLDVGVEKDATDEKAGNPLHHLNPSSDLQCIQQLGSLFSLAERRKKDLITPFEQMCLSLLVEEDSRVEMCYNIPIGLLPVGVFSEPHQASPVWSFLCLKVVPQATEDYSEKAWVRKLVADLLDRGVSELYEEENDTSALLPFISDLVEVGSSELEIWIEDAKEGQITDYFATFENWKWISETTARVTKDTKFQANVAAEPSLIQLLSEAIIHEDLDMVGLLLEIGVDCHSRVAGLSPFELACLPNTPENIEIFDLLLERTNTSHSSQGNPVFSGYGPLHLTAGVGSWPDGGSVKKLQRLLEAGAGPDSPLVTWSPLGYHILQDSIDTAETLIEAGADIWSSVPGLYDGPLAAMAGGHLSLLFKMAEHTTAKGLVPQWDRICTVTIGDRDVSGINALHLAAASDRVECLELYLNRGLLPDLEARDDRQETPVHYAVRFGNVSVLELLKNHGADINSSSASGEPRYTWRCGGSIWMQSRP
jgi:ankyrin repeat protein